MVASQRLSSAQLALLEMFSFEMSDTEVLAMRQTLMEHFRQRLDDEADEVMQQKGLTITELEDQMKFDNRTERLGQIRGRQ